MGDQEVRSSTGYVADKLRMLIWCSPEKATELLGLRVSLPPRIVTIAGCMELSGTSIGRWHNETTEWDDWREKNPMAEPPLRYHTPESMVVECFRDVDPTIAPAGGALSAAGLTLSVERFTPLDHCFPATKTSTTCASERQTCDPRELELSRGQELDFSITPMRRVDWPFDLYELGQLSDLNGTQALL